MTKKTQKPTVFSEFMERLRAENSENVAKSPESFKVIMGKLSLLGAFSMIKTFADNAEKVITSSPYTPISLLKLYMNAIINVCVVLEKAIDDAEKEQKEQIKQASQEMEEGDFDEELEEPVVYGKEEETDDLINDTNLFNEKLNKFKKDKN